MLKKLLSQNNYTKQLVAISLPVIMSQLLQMTYNVVDLYWVGSIGSGAVAAVGSAGFFVNLGLALCCIVSIGAMVKISQAVGAKDRAMQDRYVAASLILVLIIGVIYIATLLIFPERLIAILDIEDSGVSGMAVSYLRIIASGAILSYVNLVLTAALNAHGKTKLSFKAVLYGNIVNLILDPIFIVLFDWGVEGAAAATVVSWVVSFVYFYRIIHLRKLIHIKFEGLRRSIFTMIVKIGSAGAAQRILFTLIAIAIGRIVASFGSDAIAAQKVGLQIESLSFMVIGGMQQALSIMVGQAYGAKKIDNIGFLYHSALKITGVVAILTTILFVSIPDQLVGIFVDDQGTIEAGRYYLIIVGMSQIFMVLEMVTGGLFNGVGLTYYSASISIVFTSLRIPLAIYLCSTPLGIVGVWWSISITSIIKGIVSATIYRVRVRKILNQKR